jgi:hypothetical protein
MEVDMTDENDKRFERGDILMGPAYFIQEETRCLIRITDMTPKGVGAYCRQELKPGARGVISVAMSEAGDSKNIQGEVTWCMLDPSAEDSELPYRLGLRLLE